LLDTQVEHRFDASRGFPCIGEVSPMMIVEMGRIKTITAIANSALRTELMTTATEANKSRSAGKPKFI
jgi:hypothetical protein